MKAIITALAILLIAATAFAEIKTYTHTIKQPFGGSQSPDNARIAAIARAKRECLERAGTYLETLSVVKQGQLDKDQILALAAGVLKTKIVSEENYATKDVFGIVVKAEVDVDTSILEQRIKKFLEDKTLLEKYQKSQEREKELLAKIKELEKQNQKLQAMKAKAPEKEKQELKQEFREASQGLSAVEWHEKALDLWEGKKYSDSKKALEYLNQAIRLDPDRAAAYGSRGIVYAQLGQYQQAIADYNQVIRLDPDETRVYNNRGIVYSNLGQYQRAIEDYNYAIRLNPNDANAYYNRGNVYSKNLIQLQRAIEDYNQAICLDPNNAIFYSGRGLAYGKLGQYQREINDCNHAISLDQNCAIAYSVRANAYLGLGQYQRTIEDHNQAVRLDPNNADLYYYRALAYIILGSADKGCEDLKKSCELGNCAGLDGMISQGYCTEYQNSYHLDRGNTNLSINKQYKKAYEHGNHYSKLGQYEQAIGEYTKAIGFNPNSAGAYYNRGYAYVKLKKYDKACEDFKKACVLGSCKGLESMKRQGYCK